MEIFGLSIKGTLKPNIRVLVVPVVLIGLLFVVSVVVLKNGINQISSQMKTLNELSGSEKKLEEKANLLKNMGPIVVDQADQTVIAIPEKNPAVVMLFQLSNLANEKELIVTEKEVAVPSRSKDGIESSIVTLKAVGQIEQILPYLLEIKTLAPLSNIIEVNMKEDKTFLEIETKVAVYYSDFPTTIPSVAQPVNKLSKNEEQIYERISDLRLPNLSELSPNDPTIREDPFN